VGLQSYYRLLLGLTFILFGIAIARTGIVSRWLGWIAVLAGVLYGAIGVSVGHTGFEQPGDLVIQVLLAIVMVCRLVDALRRQDPIETAH